MKYLIVMRGGVAGAILLAFCALLFPPPGPAASQPRDKIIVGSKMDTEGAILGEIILQTLQHMNVPVESRLRFGPTRAVRTALLAGKIDIYPEYTGNGALFFNMPNKEEWRSAAMAYNLVKKIDLEQNNIVWLGPAPINNAWAIAVRNDLAAREHLQNMEDFARFATNKRGSLKLAASAEFIESPAALPAFQDTYGFKLMSGQIFLRPGGSSLETMQAAYDQTAGVNCAMVYGTDGNIDKFELTVMTDTLHAQIVYQPAAIVRASVLEKAVEDKISKAFTHLSLAKLRDMNALVGTGGRSAREVARNYLENEKLLD
jgi:osmoprotectant transport system substrate-binding protein